MKIQNMFFPLLLGMSVTACKHQPAAKPVLMEAASIIKKDSSTTDSIARANDEDYLAPKTFKYEGYSLKYRYLKHEIGEEGSGENPALLQVYKSEKLLFTDSFKAEGSIYIDSLGYHAVSGRKLFFIVNSGIEACDYVQTGRYYFISPEGDVHYVKDYWSACGGDGYSCRSFQHYFPDDSSGIADRFRVIETLHYNENDQRDKCDTTDWQLEGDKYSITKETHYLDSPDE